MKSSDDSGEDQRDLPTSKDPWETELYREIQECESSMLDKNAGDYGYGGEWHSHVELDVFGVQDFILARERRFLNGHTLEEVMSAGGVLEVKIPADQYGDCGLMRKTHPVECFLDGFLEQEA